MTGLTAIADDLTGACDVAAELAAAGRRVEVAVNPGGMPARDHEGIVIVNTQSRSLEPALAYARVREAILAHRAPVILKKIDTALRGHLGAELDGALDAIEAPAFILAAIPAAGRVTRDGCQWFEGRLLAATEFAHDPEGPGAESSIPVVLARESGRRVVVLGRDVAKAGRLVGEVGRHRGNGIDVFVVDAETTDDLEAAVGAILTLSRPVILAGSIALAAALAPRLEVAASAQALGGPARGLPLPALIVSGSLHSRARAQLQAVLATGLAAPIPLPSLGAGGAPIEATVRAAQARLVSGTSVILAPATPESPPAPSELRATECLLADVVAALAARVAIPTIVLIGGESSYAVLVRLGAGVIAVHGRVAPLIARGTIMDGALAGAAVITKGGSGGERDVLARLLAPGARGASLPAERES